MATSRHFDNVSSEPNKACLPHQIGLASTTMTRRFTSSSPLIAAQRERPGRLTVTSRAFWCSLLTSSPLPPRACSPCFRAASATGKGFRRGIARRGAEGSGKASSSTESPEVSPFFSTMNEAELVDAFNTQMKQDPDVASAVAAIRVLLEFLKRDKGETIQGLRVNLKDAIETLSRVDSSVAISSGGELFLRFISLTSLENPDYSKCKEIMIERGEVFLQRISLSRKKIAKLCHNFVKDGGIILTHAYSKVVLRVLEEAAQAKKRFSVYVTESQPDRAGQKMAEALKNLGIPVTIILDAAVGYIMERVDLVIVGAEGVVENGGIINKIGTNQMAVCAKVQNKPFYVVAESFKFVRLFPLNQQDVPDKFKYKADTLKTQKSLTVEHPWIDYTSPSLITLLFTDLGVLTPSAVSDELIKLYL